ncbi:hypothetical protein BJF92_06595 [Rhizobium rhizosphaerae]|uniref:GtrA/DPMS transmembrane domain-containing protein n=1 Tax=Xaviernesmea rhizosphaerae TaxID=1672749 RepID=A0A1Q9AP21_9HYPH|nr:GtrA family protein [Xaviernesmea rhizosphaerae]OLP57189.1 hypothetical protein BJF92_06595 [Xaviernesmea rhizosphaerae]
MSRTLRFLGVGAFGFLVDAGTTLALVHLGLNPFAARLLAILVALGATYLANRTVTFQVEGRANVAEGARYGGVGLMTSAINYLVYSAALALLPSLPPLLALATGSAVAMALSYLGYSRLVFRPR